MPRFAALIWGYDSMDKEEAQSLVTRFLRLMEERDLQTAESLMADQVRITFPGGRTFTSQRDVVAAAGGRYHWIKKRFATIDAFQQGDQTIVYVLGTLYGLNLHDIPFSGIRFVDRFVIEDGLIVQQDVWNDLAESGVLAKEE